MLDEQALTQALAVLRKMYASLAEVAELTDEMSQAVDRQDQVSVRMLLSMRQEAIDRLLEHKAALNRQCVQLPAESGALLRRILAGKDCAPTTPTGKSLAQQVRNNRSLLERVRRVDQSVSRRFGGSSSFYAK